MPDEARLVGAFVASLLATLALTPVAIRVAVRVGFYDEPAGYKGHGRATPYLGGTAVLLGFLIGGLLPGEVSGLFLIPLGALALWAVGTVDDRATVPPSVRVAIELAAAGLLFAGGLGWSVFGAPVPDFLLTALWVVGIVNAFNLMDNMDGATSTIAALSSAATAGFALVVGDPTLAVFALALTGACLGFLRYNLAAPARIFLGDGGSMPIGFLVAALIMALPLGEEGGAHRLLAAVLLAGLPILDTTLVLVSRRRAGVSFLQGGRDHLTHRLRSRLPSARAVALALAAGQVVLCLLAFGVARLGDLSVVLAWTIMLSLVAAGIGLLESAAWAPARPIYAVSEQPRRWVRAKSAVAWPPTRLFRTSSTEPPGSEAPRGPTGFEPAPTSPAVEGPKPPAQAPTRPVELVLVVGVAAVAGLSPLFSGFYDISRWGPIALVLLAVLFGLVVARPALPRAGALIAVASLTGLWALSLVSTAWAESAESALTDANRWMLYAAMLAILVLLLRDDRIARVLMGTTTLLAVGVALYLLGSMLADGATDLFAYRRLHNPLGYANGEAAYFLLGVWPLLAVAERARHPALAGAALGLAVPLIALVVLSQSRAAVLALVVAAVVLLAAVPGRRRRGWALVVLGSGIAAISGPLTAVFERPVEPDLVSATLTREAAAATLVAVAGVAIVWALARAIEQTALARTPSVVRPLGVASAGVLIVGVLMAAVALVSAVENPAERLAGQYRAFTRVEAQPAGPSRFASGGGTRAEYWRVARNQFRAHPLRGVGAGNYRSTYFLERRITEDITQPHSLPIQALAELGILGGLAVAGLVLSVLVGFGRRALALVVAFAAVQLGRSTLAELNRGQARDALAAGDAPEALRQADEALALDADSLRSQYVKAAAHARQNDYTGARAALLEAARREPHNFVPWVLLGDIATRRGNLDQAARDRARALSLNPRDPGLNALRRQAAAP